MAKQCSHPSCVYPQFGGSFCRFHQRLRTDKKQKPLRRISAKKAEQKKIEKDNRGDQPTELQQWFLKIGRREPPVCWETKEPIYDFSFGNICHILPKNLFPSVKTHPQNYLILSMWGGVHDRTHRWDTFQKMRVWKIAVDRFIMMEPDIAPEERKNIPQCLLDILAERDPFINTCG